MFGNAQIIGAGQNSTAHAEITGQGSSLTMGGNASFFVGSSGSFGSAQVDVLDRALLKLNPGGGSINIRERGAMTVENATVVSEGSGGFNNRGSLHVGTFGLVNLTNGGAFDNEGGTVSGTGVIDVNGQIFDNSGGTISPGSSPGVLAIRDGGLISDNLSVLKVELGGIERGQYDELQIGGNASFDGELIVSLVDDYRPMLGDSYDIIIALTVAGGFDTVTCMDCLGRELGIVFGSGVVTLSITTVPLPPTAWLFVSALAVLRVRGAANKRTRGG